MADSDFNIIKPVESLQTIQGVTPTTRQQERRRRQKSSRERRDETQEKQDEVVEPKTPDDNEDPHAIDYCA